MPSLLEIQRGFADSLFSEPHPAFSREVAGGDLTADERLEIYRNSSRSTLVAALRLNYPALARLVGDEFFAHAAERYVAAHLPSSAYLNEYGAHFADFLDSFPGARELEYLPDVARFEWALAGAANAEDRPALGAEELAALPSVTGLRFMPHSSVRMLWLRYPADRIADAVMSGDDAAMRGIDLTDGPARIVIHRGASGVEAERLSATEYALLGDLFAGQDWSVVVGRAPDQAAAVLAAQLSKGRLGGLRIEEESNRP